MLLSADKTNNLYEISTGNYNKLQLDNVTKSYKKAPEILENKINNALIAESLSTLQAADTRDTSQALVYIYFFSSFSFYL